MDWRKIKYFNESEFSCKCGCGLNNINEELVKLLDVARDIARVPFYINSACRCLSHNTKEGGSPTSSHLKGLAVDIRVFGNDDRYKIIKALNDIGIRRILLYSTFIHCDIDYSKTNPILKIM